MEYKHQEVSKTVFGTGGEQYWLFEPSVPKPDSAPVIVFNHGWGGVYPAIYGAWIEHLVRRGNIVIFPRYQEDLKTPPKNFISNALAAVKDALKRLDKEPGHVKPQLDKFALVGHSAGGIVTANLAALAKSSGLPKPLAVMCVEPGNSWTPERISIPVQDLNQVQKGTLLLTVVGEADNIVRGIDAKRIFRETTNIPLADKNFVTLVSDSHGRPELTANHFAPVAFSENYSSGDQAKGRREGPLRNRIRQRRGHIPNQEGGGKQSVDALDYYGLWKLFDGLCEAAFYHKNRSYALGNTPEQRYMGRWSDGVAVKELRVTDHP